MPDASTLVDPTTYATVTGDTSSTSDKVTAALDDALGLIQDYLGRTLPAGTYRETLRVYSDGKVYPTATPIQSVTTPNVASVSIQGAGIYLGYWNPAPVVASQGEWSASVPPQATVTYAGGYTIDTLPVKLSRALCRVAYNVLHPVPAVGVPTGASSVSVGDVHYSGPALRTLDPLDDGVKKDLRGYRNPQFMGWATRPVPVP